MEFQTVGVIGKPRSAPLAPVLRALHRHLRRRGCTVLVERETAAAVRGERFQTASRERIARHAQLAVILGGDGTLLKAGRSLSPAGVPLLGVNQGRLGFMVDVAPEDMRATLDQVLDGRYVRDRRLVLSAQVRRRNGRAERPFLAINDVVLRQPAAVRMLEFETWLDDEFISQHRADGIIVSTPTGSTAYALSGGGSVLHPGLEAVALVPICPHALSDRPVVVSCDRAVRLVLGGPEGTRALCTADGQHNVTLAVGDSVVITRSAHVLELIHPENYQYFNILRKKLQWGRERASGRR